MPLVQLLLKLTHVWMAVSKAISKDMDMWVPLAQSRVGISNYPTSIEMEN